MNSETTAGAFPPSFVEGQEKTLEERVRWLELYATSNVDSWIMRIEHTLAELDVRLKEIEVTNRREPMPSRKAVDAAGNADIKPGGERA